MNTIVKTIKTVGIISVCCCIGYGLATLAISVGSFVGTYNTPLTGAFLGATVGYVNVW